MFTPTIVLLVKISPQLKLLAARGKCDITYLYESQLRISMKANAITSSCVSLSCWWMPAYWRVEGWGGSAQDGYSPPSLPGEELSCCFWFPEKDKGILVNKVKLKQHQSECGINEVSSFCGSLKTKPLYMEQWQNQLFVSLSERNIWEIFSFFSYTTEITIVIWKCQYPRFV